MGNWPDCTFHHLGLAVKDPAPARSFLQVLGYRVLCQADDPIQNVHLELCSKEHQPNVEIVSPLASPNPLEKVLAHSRESYYHLCFQTRNLEALLEHLESHGQRLFPQGARGPSPLFEQTFSFYYLPEVGLLEILSP